MADETMKLVDALIDAEATNYHGAWEKRAAGVAAARAALVAHLEALERDAGRYRWLRTKHWSDKSICVVDQRSTPLDAIQLGTSCPALEQLDAAIDAGLAAQTGEPT